VERSPHLFASKNPLVVPVRFPVGVENLAQRFNDGDSVLTFRSLCVTDVGAPDRPPNVEEVPVVVRPFESAYLRLRRPAKAATAITVWAGSDTRSSISKTSSRL
jgi:hypothetical protein